MNVNFCLTSQNTDSLFKILPLASDSAKAEIFVKIVSSLENDSLEKAAIYADSALFYMKTFHNLNQQISILETTALFFENSNNLQRALSCYEKILGSANQLNDKNLYAKTLTDIGYIFERQNNMELAISNYQKAREIYESTKNNAGLAKVLNYIGLAYYFNLKYTKAIEFFQQALKLTDTMGDLKNSAKSLNNLGIIYEKLDNYNKSIEYHNKSLDIEKKLKNKSGIAGSLANIGTVYKQMGNYAKALEYNKLSLSLEKELGNIEGLAESYNNIGLIYEKIGDYTQAIDYMKLSLALERKISNYKGVAGSYTNLANLYFKLNDYQQALDFYEKAQTLADSLKYTQVLIDLYSGFAQTYEALKNFEQANKFLKKYFETKNSILDEEKYRQIIEIQAKYESEKNEKDISLLSQQQLLMDLEILENQQKINKQRIIIYSFVAFFVVIVTFLAVIYKLYNQKKIANMKLEAQNKQILKQKQEITDSIHYARRIQNAILPRNDDLQNTLPDFFILYKPRDIVSGDFYWVAQKENTNIVVVADCTGHGVPGAFMSMLGVAFLNEIVNKDNTLSPDKILNTLRDKVIGSLQQLKNEDSRDGMDISIFVYDKETMQAEFAGANNPLYLVRNQKLEIFKAEKMPIAIYPKIKPFTSQCIKIESGDLIYMFSDGYIDQFGGSQGRKFMSYQFKELMLEIAHLPLNEQKIMLERNYERWTNPAGETGEHFEQIDDILIFGVRIS